MINNRKVYAIIPARAGSKGIPKKNIKKLTGIPLINYSIKYAQSSYIDDIIISTDCNDVKKIVSESFPELNKIKILNRPSEFATDEATTESVIKHVIDSNSFEQDAILILLQPTSPLRPKNSLNKSTQTILGLLIIYLIYQFIISFYISTKKFIKEIVNGFLWNTPSCIFGDRGWGRFGVKFFYSEKNKVPTVRRE